MSKVAADAKALFMPIPRRARRTGIRIAEGQAVVHIVADRLNPLPPWPHVAEARPGGIREAIGLAVSAAEKKLERLRGQVLDRNLTRTGHRQIRLAAIVHDIFSRNRKLSGRHD